MPSLERDVSPDRDSLMLKHQHSFSESGRSSVPMYVPRLCVLYIEDNETKADHDTRET